MIKIDSCEESKQFRPVILTITFDSQEDLNAFADFIVQAGTRNHAHDILNSKNLRRLPKGEDFNFCSRVLRPMASVLKRLTPRPTSMYK